MKIIHCNLWGDIELSDLAISIIDTPHFQRLHYIKQTGMSYKVFPGAMTTRFEHSLGVYNVIRTLLIHLMNNQPELNENCDKRKQELICIAGLIHDLGHGPYSHLFDLFLKKFSMNNSWDDHENRSLDLFIDLVEKFNIKITRTEVDFIGKLVTGNGEIDKWYSHIVNNKISGLDMDKMDYVLRDSMNFGMKIFLLILIAPKKSSTA
jgi:HD superfamily phosphohydrolase